MIPHGVAICTCLPTCEPTPVVMPEAKFPFKSAGLRLSALLMNNSAVLSPCQRPLIPAPASAGISVPATEGNAGSRNRTHSGSAGGVCWDELGHAPGSDHGVPSDSAHGGSSARLTPSMPEDAPQQGLPGRQGWGYHRSTCSAVLVELLWGLSL